MRCSIELLSAFVDGDLGQRKAARVQAHLDGCERCRAARDELLAMKADLAREAAHPPEPNAHDDGWVRLAARLSAANLETERSQRRLWPRLALVPAGVALAAAIAWFAVEHRQPTPSDDQVVAEAEIEFRSAEAQYVRALDKLRSVTQGQRTSFPEARRRDYDAAQAQLEAALAECQRVARARPADAEAEELLFAAYRKEIAFFQDQLLAPRVQ